MTEEKAEWERLLDDSYQWHIGHIIATLMTLGVVVVAVVLWDFRIMACANITAALYFGCVIKEGRMVRKAQELRKKEL